MDLHKCSISIWVSISDGVVPSISTETGFILIKPISGGEVLTSTTEMFGTSEILKPMETTLWKFGDLKDVVMVLTISDIELTEVIGLLLMIGLNGVPTVVVLKDLIQMTVLVSVLKWTDLPVLMSVKDIHTAQKKNSDVTKLLSMTNATNGVTLSKLTDLKIA